MIWGFLYGKFKWNRGEGEKKKKRKELPASNTNIETTNDSVFFFRETSMLNIWTKIIQPSQPTAFPTSLKS